MDRKILVLLGIYGFLVILDIAANAISFIPFLGDIAESVSEIIIEALSAGIVGYLALKAGG